LSLVARRVRASHGSVSPNHEDPVKTKLISLIACALLSVVSLASPVAAANDAEPRPAAQPERPQKPAAPKESGDGPAEGSQQNKMKHCNEEARKKELKGDERRAFMSVCLRHGSTY
jgi:hypothetical protein